MKKSYIILGVVLLIITVIVVIAFKNKKFLSKVPTEIKPAAPTNVPAKSDVTQNPRTATVNTTG